MILTCPACATQYAVKDDAIPPGGRKVRCVSCKHSWHQEPAEAQPALPETGIAPPPPDPAGEAAAVGEIPAEARAEGMIAEEPQPAVDADEHGVDPAPREERGIDDGRVDLTTLDAGEPAHAAEHAPGLDDYAPPAEALEAPEDEPAEAAFVTIPAMYDDEDEPRRGRALGWLVGLVVLVVAAAAAFWFFAPPELKARAGIAEAGATPLQLMLTTSDRQKLASGNELLAISGRIINPTDREQAVPPIKAELRNKASRQLVYSWTIAPPARVLAPRASASFNSAEVDIPEGGDELTVTLGDRIG